MCPLSQCRDGETVYIRGFVGGSQIRQKLQAMGLMPGEQIEILSCGNGPVLVLAKGVRLALGQGLAEHILVACQRNCPRQQPPPA